MLIWVRIRGKEKLMKEWRIKGGWESERMIGNEKEVVRER